MRRVLSAKSAMRKALVLSIGVHAALFGLARPVALRLAAAAPVEVQDRWTGTTAELPGAGKLDAPAVQEAAVYDVSLDGPAVPAAPPAPATPAPLAAAQAADAIPVLPARPHEPAPKPPPTSAPSARPRPSARASATHVDPAVPTRKRRRDPASSDAARPHAQATASGTAPGHRHDGGDPQTPGPAGGGGGGGTFGAEGPASLRDLGRAFTRAIPPANSADAAWGLVALGDAGRLEVEVRVDENGHITSAEPRGKEPPAHLVNLLRRTIPLLQAGTFAVRDGAVSEGVEILELRALVREGRTPDGDAAGANDREALPDDLAWRYERGRGKATFAQKSGRRVEISVKVLRTSTR